MSAGSLRALSVLTLAKNAQLDDEQVGVFVKLLADIPDELLSAACVRLAKAQTFGFPDVGTIRAMCDQVQRDAVSERKALMAPAPQGDEDRRRWVHCADCQDDPGAWLPAMWCHGSGKGWDDQAHAKRIEPPMKFSNCGSDRHHAPHSFTERCTCHRAAWREALRSKKYAEDAREQRGRA